MRITHLPSGIVVQCQNERSQHKNRELTMKILRSRLYDLEIEKRREETRERDKSKMDISFGSQIRTYTLQPYQLVKDHRTNSRWAMWIACSMVILTPSSGRSCWRGPERRSSRSVKPPVTKMTERS